MTIKSDTTVNERTRVSLAARDWLGIIAIAVTACLYVDRRFGAIEYRVDAHETQIIAIEKKIERP